MKLSDLLKKAKDAFQKNDLKTASLFLNEIIEQNPNATEAFFYLANVFHVRGELGKAIKAFSRVLELDPHHTDAAISLSVIYNDIGKYEEAKAIFEKANNQVKNTQQQGLSDPHLNKKFSLKHYELAEMYASYGRVDEALFEYNKAITLDPDNLEIRIKVAKTYTKKGFTSKAFEELKRLKNEQPGYMPARIALGLLFYGNGNIIEAQAEWQNVLSREPNHPEATMYISLSRSATETTVNL
ncbi:tetratricopeptide repeat protein [Peredibacter starrii]|uniref:Tetratricopeptide repeat protein n=1 Tax=Peredibacter starrii TaxID=28202 RepID=A0AAX4HPW6_9BACT|nr:tetratricopeptide repeat protein [Peredibacter starrii]WPU65299.1 tetratricopeptide repeat protein [Peredibacter starrii]